MLFTNHNQTVGITGVPASQHQKKQNSLSIARKRTTNTRSQVGTADLDNTSISSYASDPVPVAKITTRNVFLNPILNHREDKKLGRALSRIEHEMNLQTEELRKVAVGIERHAQLAIARLDTNNARSTMAACVSMKQVKIFQEDYVRSLKIVHRLTKIQTCLLNGRIKPEKVAEMIEEAVALEYKHDNKGVYSNTQCLLELRQGLFYPTLGGKFARNSLDDACS